MSDRPAFQFYPKDWRNNAKLQRCDLAAKGAWTETMCLLHDADEYGVLRWPLVDIAQAAHVPVALLRDLAAKGVLKGSDAFAEDYTFRPFHAGKHGAEVVLVKADGGPCWFCSRFVKDEWRRHQRGKASQFSATNQPPKPEPIPAPKPPIGDRQGDGPSFASASASSVKQKAGAGAPTIASLLMDVDPVVVADFTTLRKAKRAPITVSAIQDIQREAVKAGLSLEDTLRMMCARGWQGFKAEWAQAKLGDAAVGKPGGGRPLIVGGRRQ